MSIKKRKYNLIPFLANDKRQKRKAERLPEKDWVLAILSVRAFASTLFDHTAVMTKKAEVSVVLPGLEPMNLSIPRQRHATCATVILHDWDRSSSILVEWKNSLLYQNESRSKVHDSDFMLFRIIDRRILRLKNCEKYGRVGAQNTVWPPQYKEEAFLTQSKIITMKNNSFSLSKIGVCFSPIIALTLLTSAKSSYRVRISRGQMGMHKR